MKKCSLLLLFTLATYFNTFAQVQKGCFFLGGGVGLDISSAEDGVIFVLPDLYTYGRDASGFGFSVRSEGGFLLSENIAIGMSLSYARGEVEATQDRGVVQPVEPFDPWQVLNTYISGIHKQTSHRFNVGPFLRYFKPLLNDRLGIQIDLSTNIGFGKNSSVFERGFSFESNTSTSYRSFTAGVSPGLYYFISPRIAINATVGGMSYLRESEEVDDRNKTSSSDFDLFFSNNLNNRIAVTFFLNCKDTSND